MIHEFAVASCFQGKSHQQTVDSADLSVLLGKFNLSKPIENGSSTSSVSKLIIHPDWKPEEERYDANIAIVELAEPVHFTTYIQAVHLPKTNYNEIDDVGTIVSISKFPSISK